MLNPFPSLLVYSFFTPTLLRVVAAAVFIYIAQYLLREAKKLESVQLPIVGHMRGWMLWLSVCITVLVAFSLFIGYGVQWAALVGMLIALKHGAAPKRYHSLLPLPRSSYVLLFVICLSLLFSGAGALAFDLPL